MENSSTLTYFCIFIILHYQFSISSSFNVHLTLESKLHCKYLLIIYKKKCSTITNTTENLFSIKVFQGGVLQFACLCNDQQTHPTGIMERPKLPWLHILRGRPSTMLSQNRRFLAPPPSLSRLFTK